MYGIDEPANMGFARNCLTARRLLERGVRFVQILNGGSFGSPRINWDGHENVKENHDKQAATMDKPVAALIRDLKQRGMLEDTAVRLVNRVRSAVQSLKELDRRVAIIIPQRSLVSWQVRVCRKVCVTDRRMRLDTSWMKTKSRFPDFHATILHLLGLNHEKLTYYHNGINRRLTDVHGQVIEGILS